MLRFCLITFSRQIQQKKMHKNKVTEQNLFLFLLQNQWPDCSCVRPPVGCNRRPAGPGVDRQTGQQATDSSTHAETCSGADQDHVSVRRNVHFSCYSTRRICVRLAVTSGGVLFQGHPQPVMGHPGSLCCTEGLVCEHRGWAGCPQSWSLDSLGNTHSSMA